ncbi:type I restriction enzyme, R subunit [Williamsoniiplasma luminosum]|uniref:Type I restriction enzyme endonuclease subunit n=1 Tax=Williamsoniiplasma luminosum TaxID=214888 RepID=A0A2K8NTQ6_9MOLU|nr:type I restriction endonuclease subunit R [Williamsoniiplasma luminosum]ATZ17147.1 type I restriction enzyme, R subunit [Williamsoniiplasma luminosum]
MNKDIKIIMETTFNTVVNEYVSKKQNYNYYESEAQLEDTFIKDLINQGYQYLALNTDQDLILNLRKQLEKLNNIEFTEKEWKDFYNNVIANKAEGLIEKTRKIQEDYKQYIKRESDGSPKNIYLIDKTNVHNNTVQVINQFEENEGNYKGRYDVTILVNGLPMVHIELKRRGVNIREAFNQIQRYARDNFWAGSGLFEYVQLFVISNGTNTKYYSNTTRKEQVEKTLNHKQLQSKAFEFTSNWTDEKNNLITDLKDFTSTFFNKRTLLNILTRYCVFTVDENLLVMRPYQITATEKIINKITISSHYKKEGTKDAGGYIWHTTGSGKTLTSFKTAKLATELDFVDKVLFVVDRKDLDYQTIKEYDKFEKGSANGNKSTEELKKNLEDPLKKIVITTIQKLSNFVKKYKKHDIYNKHLVLIFDECHRSQFGDMNKAITKSFKKYHLFGFTGTPIFAENTNDNVGFQTTEATFGEKLHAYTIVNAINDGNVLPWRVEYLTTFHEKDEIVNKKVKAIDKQSALNNVKRIREIVKYIIDRFDTKTLLTPPASIKNPNPNLTKKKYNSILAVSSIEAAKAYYLEFKKTISEENLNLKVATIFSFNPNEDMNEIDEDFDVSNLDSSSKDFLASAINDYNEVFKTNFSVNGDSFQNYYKDLSEKTKQTQIDILIVVNMFLTGFDAPNLNTLWVDKELKYHNLIQAFSRTNRILNNVKKFGNIICFRNIEQKAKEAIALFGDENANSIVLIKTYEEYYNGYIDKKGEKNPGYKKLIEQLLEQFPLNEQIIGELQKNNFVGLYGKILQYSRWLKPFDEFENNQILTPRQIQDYQSLYLDFYEEKRGKSSDVENINDDLVFEIELVRQVDINVDYILQLIKANWRKNSNLDPDIISKLDSSPDLRNKKDLILEFVKHYDGQDDIEGEFSIFIKESRFNDLKTIIDNNNLNEKATLKFIELCFDFGYLKTIGEEIDKILPPISRFDTNNIRPKIKEKVTNLLQDFFEKYYF